MKISEKLKSSLINLNLSSEEKSDVFEEMVQMFVDSGDITDSDNALNLLEEREAKMSTGIAPGLALPHTKLPELKKGIIGLGISKSGIDYDSLDGKPVYVVIMILGVAENPAEHVQILAEISRLFSIPGFQNKLCNCATAQEVIDTFRQEE